MEKQGGNWQDSKTLAKAILRDRKQRRKLLANLLFGVLLMMILGLWVIDGWLQETLLYFAGWWLACGLITCGVVLFAIYDMLAVIREERDRSSNEENE